MANNTVDLDMSSTALAESKNDLPGFGKPLKFLPKWEPQTKSTEERFPHAICDFVASAGVTLRERRMLEFIDKISDKPEWHRKVHDETIAAKWKEEACRHSEELEDEYLSSTMFDFCIQELRDKAKRYKETGCVAVLDAEATVVKSDTAVSNELKQALKESIRPLEDVPEIHKDWHPGSNETVLDLLHPSLFPLTYGQSRILPHGTVPLTNCAAFTGRGVVVEKTDENLEQSVRGSWGNRTNLKVWGSYQWLPTDVYFSLDGRVKISSYINNLHPIRHERLYRVLEQLVERAIPLWNECLSWFHDRIRIPVEYTSDEDFVLPEGLKYERPPLADGEEDPYEDDEEFYWNDPDYLDWKNQHRVLVEREPREFKSFADSVAAVPPGARLIDLQRQFASTGLQVIFKIANILLTPDKPEYEGSSWHVEGK